MAWMIGRAAALSDPETAKAKVLAKLAGLAEIKDAEALVVPILIDAILMAESYRGARHQVDFLRDLTEDVMRWVLTPGWSGALNGSVPVPQEPGSDR